MLDYRAAGAGYSLPTSIVPPLQLLYSLGLYNALCLDELVTCQSFSYKRRIFLGNNGANSVTRKQLSTTSHTCSENYSEWFGQNQGSGSSSYTERLSLWYFFPVAFVSTFDAYYHLWKKFGARFVLIIFDDSYFSCISTGIMDCFLACEQPLIYPCYFQRSNSCSNSNLFFLYASKWWIGLTSIIFQGI
jgi:hypothetical protein